MLRAGKVKYTRTNMPPAVDPSRCPLCGASNACGGEAGVASCWCRDLKIPAEVLDRIPAAARDRACVCERCAGGANAGTPTARPLRTVAR